MTKVGDLPPLTTLSPDEEQVAFAALELLVNGAISLGLAERLQRPSYLAVLTKLYAKLKDTVQARLSCERSHEGKLDLPASGSRPDFCPRCGKPYDGAPSQRCWCV